MKPQEFNIFNSQELGNMQISNKIGLLYHLKYNRFYISFENKVFSLYFYIESQEMTINNICENFENIKSSIDNNILFSKFLSLGDNKILLYLTIVRLKNKDFFKILISESEELRAIWEDNFFIR